MTNSFMYFIICVNLHKVKIMNSRLSALILLLLIPGFVTLDQLSVTCSEESICAVKGTEVTLMCSYSNINIKTVFWFSEKQSTNWRKNNEPEDLTLDSDYSGRVKHQISSSSSTLTISDVRERDSGEYQLMFIMNDGVKHLRSAAISLTVTGLSQSGCWDVTYSSRRVCALVGSTVDISCTYSHPSGHTVNKTFWHYGPSWDFKDLRISLLVVWKSADPHLFICCLSIRAAGVMSLCSSIVTSSPSNSQNCQHHIISVIHLKTIRDFIFRSFSLDKRKEIRRVVSTCLLKQAVELETQQHIMKSSSVSFIVCVNLHKVKIMNSRLSALILLLLIPGFVTLDQLSVTCSQESICAVKGTEVTLTCSYSNINITTVFWFSEKQSTNWRKNNEPEDLTLDSDYSGRVKHQISNRYSTLTISDVRERDSGEYQLMFIMNDGVKHLRSAAVSLTVTDLHLRMNPVSTNLTDERVELTCDTSCTLTSGVWYYWMKDGWHFRQTQSPNISVSHSRDAGSFSLSLSSDRKHTSSSMCVSQSVCWDVTYTSTRVCALVNSTVDISCTYSHPSGHTVNKTFWHYGPSGVFKDLREEHQFAGRVEYVGNKLRIKDLKISDSGEYRFRIITDLNQYSGSPGVILTVTGTQIKSSTSVVTDEEEVILSCSTKCTLNDKHTYIWYKNGRQVTDGFTKVNKLYLDSVSNEELQQYSCAVGDPTSPESSTALLITVIILSVLLILTLIGVLWYRRRKNNSSQQHEDTMESEQLGSDMLYENAAALSTVCTQQVHTNDQDVHYSAVNFKQSHTNNTLAAPTVVQSTTDDVHYAAVKFR
ncbi:uncharacterized protein LOC127159656 [Labeo rohita]|uniref:uncharacterized protein LOC127159656 n=1 Tax=Labeo rohita TaxID=84645 RepID=UPI0021E1D3AB|nr:uncharacterized protein LOC127159656 [Labeo rohita]